MEVPTPSHARRVTREELYRMVWLKPMIRLAEEFGITGNVLAKVCDKLDVPYPRRGHWAKKEAEKPVVTLKLPPLRDGIPKAIDIQATPPKPAADPVAEKAAAAVVDRIRDVIMPESNDNLHPRVQAWIAGHRKLQKELNWRPRVAVGTSVELPRNLSDRASIQAANPALRAAAANRPAGGE